MMMLFLFLIFLTTIGNVHHFKNHSAQKGFSVYLSHRKIFWKSDMGLKFDKTQTLKVEPKVEPKVELIK